jgi:pimeloyl-ACP methyl ester carboxylesterase
VRTMPRMTTKRFGCGEARSFRIDANGLQLRLLEWGEPGRPPLCFVHGGAAHAHWFDGVAPAFADRFHVVALDQRGHGESEWPRPPSYATEDFSADLAAVMDRMRWPDMVLVGHSMGGHNALAFAAWHPRRVRALVIADARPSLPDERLRSMHRHGQRPLRRYASLEAAVAAFRLVPPDTVAEPLLLEHIARAGLVQDDGAWRWRFDPGTSGLRRPVDGWAIAHQIVAPTLVLRGERSPVLTRDMAERLRQLIPRTTVVEIPDAYHHITLDRPHQVVRALEAFFTTL